MSGGVLVSSPVIPLFTELMDGSTLTGTLINDATYDTVNGYVLLTTPFTDQKGQIEFNTSILEGLTTWAAEFEFRAWGGNGADSVYFYFYCNDTPVQEGDLAAGGYLVYLSEFSSVFGITVSGAQNIIGFFTPTENWRSVRIVYSDHSIQIYLDGELLHALLGQTVFTYVVDTSGTKIGLGARTGAQNNNHAVRNFNIYTYP